MPGLIAGTVSFIYGVILLIEGQEPLIFPFIIAALGLVGIIGALIDSKKNSRTYKMDTLTLIFICIAAALTVGFIFGGWIRGLDYRPVIKTKIYEVSNTTDILIQCADGSRRWLITSLIGESSEIAERKDKDALITTEDR